jgi:hypothetical protein
MRKIIIFTVFTLFTCMSASAQMTKKESGNGPLKDRVSNFWNKTKKSLDKIVDKVSDDIASDASGLRFVKGKYYMNVYDKNLYKGDDAGQLRDLCLKEFMAKYPSVPVQSCVIPQTEWLTETEEISGEVKGYVQTLYCYIIGKDGNEGFINAKFEFERHKPVGGQFTNTREKWPLWIRTDILTHEVMDHLTKKQ